MLFSKLLHSFLLCCLLMAASLQATAAGQRFALVIGNSSYPEGRLANPLKDATDVAATLRSLNFEVIEVHDAKRKEMYKTIRQFGKKLSRGGVGLFYYAGHGVQVEGNNYLIPVDASIEDQAEVPSEAIDVNLILRKMDGAANGLNIVILDACRNNPYAVGFRSATRGLARIEGPTGSIISFSTSPGAVAFDGEPGQNSLFTRHFLTHMKTPDLPIELMFKRVRIAVEEETNGKQVPWESSSLKGDFSFVTHDLNKQLLKYEIDKEAIAEAEKKRLEEIKKQREINAKKEKQQAISDYKSDIAALVSRKPNSDNYFRIATSYQAILELDPKHPVQRELANFVDDTLVLARKAIKSQQLQTAKQYIQAVEIAAPGRDTSKLYQEISKTEQRIASQNAYTELVTSAQQYIDKPYAKPGWLQSSSPTRKRLKSAYRNIAEAKKIKPGDKQLDALLKDLDKKYVKVVDRLLEEGNTKEAKKFIDDFGQLNMSSANLAKMRKSYDAARQDEPEKSKPVKFNNFGGF